MTQFKYAQKGITTPEMEMVSKEEGIHISKLKEGIANGCIVIPKSRLHDCRAIGIGKGLKTKVNANIGTSPHECNIQNELKKLEMCIKYKADTVMDLSTGGDINKIRRQIIKSSSIPVGTVPIYQVIVECESIEDVKEDHFIDVIGTHIKDGVDFITVHAGITKDVLPLVEKRHMGIVSRGGSFIARWMRIHKKENPLYTRFPEILDLAQKHDVTLSLGDALRPGSVIDSTDDAQLHELNVLGKLTKVAWEKGVQTMIEGPGHIPLHEIKKNVELQKKICHGAPFYVLGPLVTDIAPGYDHITSAIGGAIAAWHGADFLCYVTRAEHLRLPKPEEVREGIIASRIAAHAADIAKGVDKAIKWDKELSFHRGKLEWEKQFELAIDPDTAKKMRAESKFDSGECSMCGKFCSMKK